MSLSEEDYEEDYFSDIRRSRKESKEDILDEAFKKAEISKGLRKKEGRIVSKKPFRKIGIALIIIAIFGLIIINFVPWMYIKFDADYGRIEEFYYKDFENKEGHHYDEIDNVFDSPCKSCSSNTSNFIGLSQQDFIEIPKSSSNVFILLIILGIIFTILEILGRLKEISIEIITIIHSIFAASAVFIGIFLIYLEMKFLVAYFLLYHNRPFIETSGVIDLILIYPATLILIVIAFAVIIISTTVLKINYHEFEKRIEENRPRGAFSRFKFGNHI